MFQRFRQRSRRESARADRFTFAHLTDRARQVLVLAQQESHLLGHSFIGTEHLLLGLLREGEGVAAKALESLGISLDVVRTKVEKTVGTAGRAIGSPPFTPRAQKVLELSWREARQLGHQYIGTEHLLLGLVREGEGVAVQVLVSLGYDMSRVHQRVIETLAGYQPAEEGDYSAGVVISGTTPLPSRSPDDLRSNRRTAPRCSGCRARLRESLAYQIVDVRGPSGGSLKTLAAENVDGDDPVIRIALVYCTSCGMTIGSHEPPAAPPTPV